MIKTAALLITCAILFLAAMTYAGDLLENEVNDTFGQLSSTNS